MTDAFEEHESLLDSTSFIFLDDVRQPPSMHWDIARDAKSAYVLIREAYDAGREIVVSLDHDLGENIPTGYDLLNWLEKDIATTDFRPKIAFAIHSANPVGRTRMEQAIRAIESRLL